MSATYKCNFCGKKLDKHQNYYSGCEYVHRKMYNNSNEEHVKVEVIVSTSQEDLDMCDECVDSIRKEGFRKKIKLTNKD